MGPAQSATAHDTSNANPTPKPATSAGLLHSTAAMNPVIAHLSGLSADNFAHPADRAVLTKVRKIPLLDTLIGKLVDFQKREMELTLIASAIHVTPGLMPRLNALYAEVCRTLDVPEPPPLYLYQDPTINAFTRGADTPFVCITSGAVEHLEETELRFILGHELGHAIAGHVRYSTLTEMLIRISRSSGLVAGLAGMAVDVSALPLLLLWRRRAEFTADRAGLLACQDIDAAFRSFMKMGGYPVRFEGPIATAEFLKQLEEFERCVSSSVIDQVFSLSQQLQADHPRTVERAAELKLWIDDGSFAELLAADEPTRREMARQTERDPQYAELLSTVTRTLKRWCAEEFGVPLPEAARLLRRALSSGASLRDTPLEKLLRIELLIEPQGANRLSYAVVVLSVRRGQPTRTRLALPYDPDRDYAPEVIRHGLGRSAGGSTTWLLYSV